ncbi:MULTISPECIES: Holliday junction branch migration protein RuvA [unclassified Bartonella]|uniref:Holliday junction branch migration protein RuvA n=1 Tax=unclassified Bartonella TaxID=2645622 RepID=UPI00099AC607|nr:MULTISPECIES: Holliday junction branch migration protein RuvA [unclassified Bartonella]AQX28460.1 Holliday junction DNA helicase subunit RuvA [Bartonella sp. JB15]AQX29724.1 Holliday junction DNA helicase subunit RuvA [Bartonella sp. JB63]
MIGKLTGILEHIFDDHIILDVQGVGYTIFIPNRLHSSLPAIGGSLSLFIETHVREEAIRLFGFSTKSEKEWFCLLQNVPGVGAKVALALLGTLSINDLSQAITLNDIATISRTPGVGKKVSERIVSELKSKAFLSKEGNKNFSFSFSNLPSEENHQPTNDALLALIKLGFDHDQAATTLTSVLSSLKGETVSSALLVRHSLKLLSSQNQGNNA